MFHTNRGMFYDPFPAPTKSACLVHRDFTSSIGDVNRFCDALGLGGDSRVGAVHLAQTPDSHDGIETSRFSDL